MSRTAEELSALCVACGLCCQGALHDIVPLDEDEEERAVRLRLPVIESPILRAFKLPCPRLDERTCTIYLERPRTCATYSCGVLDAFAGRSVELAEALRRVEALREAHARDASEKTVRSREALASVRRAWFEPIEEPGG